MYVQGQLEGGLDGLVEWAIVPESADPESPSGIKVCRPGLARKNGGTPPS